MSLAIIQPESLSDRLEMEALEPPESLDPFQQAFCLNYLSTGKVGQAVLNTERQAKLPLSDKQAAIKRGMKILKRKDAKAYIQGLTIYMQDKGVAKALHLQMFLTRIIDTPIGFIDANSDLCQKRTIVRKYDGKGNMIEERETLEMPCKLKAIDILNRMCDNYAALKIDATLSVKGGVMLVPMAQNLDEWEDSAADSQANLMRDAIDV